MSVSDTAREEAIALFREQIPTTDMHSDAVVLIDALVGLGWGPVVPVPTRQQIALEILRVPFGVGHISDTPALRIADALLAAGLFSPVEGNTK